MTDPASKRKKIQQNPGDVRIVEDRCKGCAFCVEFCPTGALELSPKFNVKGYHPPVLVDRNYCNGCGLCGLYCPDFAIHGFKVRPEAGKK